MKIFLVALFLVLTVSACFAQKKAVYSSQSSKAIKNFENALKYLDVNNYDKTKEALGDAIGADPGFIEAHMLLGDVLAQQNNFKDAVNEYKKAYSINPNFFPSGYYSLANYEMTDGQYEGAKEHFLKYISNPGINPEKKEDSQLQIKKCDFAIDALKHPVLFDPKNLGANINSEYDEYFPSFTVDESELLFTRNLTSPENREGQEDFFISDKINGEWQNAKPLGPPVNSSLNEGAPSFSCDGKLIFFTECDRPEGHGSCDIYYSRLNGTRWTKPINLGPVINTGAWETQPSFASDGKTLYFVRGSGEKINNNKDADIYVSQVSANGWSEPQKLPPNINSDQKEQGVYIHPDNQTLYFMSEGHVGMGGVDIFVSKKKQDGSWGDPVNLGYPINTSGDEMKLIVNPKGDKACFSSNRPGGSGGFDLYSFDLYDAIKANTVSYVKGKVVNSQTTQPVGARFEIIDISNGNTIVESSSDNTTGEFVVTLPSGKDYALNVSKEGFLFYSDHFSCKDTAAVKDAYHLDISLHPLVAGEKVILKNIFFETNSYDLQPESFPELNKLISFLKLNPKAAIEVSGHTDNVGDVKSNQTLSEKRAKSVYDFLVKGGIDPVRLTFKGYGETKPIAPNETEDGRSLNRRTEFAITAVK
ncbi:MAG TPA: OmpA family protein [Bacteroidia bacterium]|nr:OmpA family protein [Bacteroidia bacterium]